MIRLRKEDSWHYKRYRRWEAWKRRTSPSYEPRGTLDLCHYTRVVLLWYSLRWPFQRYILGLPPVFWAGGTLVLSGLGLGLANVRDWATTGIVGGLVVAGVITAAALMLGLILAFDKGRVHERAANSVRESETAQLGWEFIKAKKQRVCPLIQRPEEGGERW